MTNTTTTETQKNKPASPVSYYGKKKYRSDTQVFRKRISAPKTPDYRDQDMTAKERSEKSL